MVEATFKNLYIFFEDTLNYSGFYNTDFSQNVSLLFFVLCLASGFMSTVELRSVHTGTNIHKKLVTPLIMVKPASCQVSTKFNLMRVTFLPFQHV